MRPEGLLAHRNIQLFCQSQHFGAHHAEHAAEPQIRCDQQTRANQEDVARRAAHQLPFRVEHQPVDDTFVVPLRLGQHLFETVEMLDPRQARIASEARLAPTQRKSRAGGLRRCWVERNDARRLALRRWSIAAWPDTARHDDLQYGALGRSAEALHVRAQHGTVRRYDAEPFAAERKASQVLLEKSHASLRQQRSLEDTVAVVETAILHSDRVQRIGRADAVDEDCSRHASTPNARNTPRAFARVSSSSRSAIESATMPAPARKLSARPSSCSERIRIFMSMLPSRFR